MAATVALPDPYRIEKVPAVVVLREGAVESEEGLHLWCREHLAGYKVPKSVEFIAALPRTATGKVLRRELWERAASRAEAGGA